MQLKEFPEIREGDRVVAAKTPIFEVVKDFSEQMYKRGNANISFYTNKDATEEELEDDYNSGASWSPDFAPNDMVNLVVTFANMTLDPRQKLLFSSQLQNALLTEALNDEYEYDEEYDGDEE